MGIGNMDKLVEPKWQVLAKNYCLFLEVYIMLDDNFIIFWWKYKSMPAWQEQNVENLDNPVLYGPDTQGNGIKHNKK